MLRSHGSWHSHLQLDEAALAELTFWEQKFGIYNSCLLWPVTKIATLIFTDASDIGWGGHISHLSAPSSVAHGYFNG